MSIRVVLACLFVASCRASTSPVERADGAPTTSVVASTAPVVAPFDVVAACSVARTRSLATLERARLGDAGAAPLTLFDGCWGSAAGAWAVVLDELCRVPAISLDNSSERIALLGRWLLTYTARDGRSAIYESMFGTGAGLPRDACISPTNPGNIAAANPSTLPRIEARAFDFDGDGHLEIFVATPARTLQDHPERGGISVYASTSGVLTYRDGHVELYRPAIKIQDSTTHLTGMRDMNGDGRPDLVFTFDNDYQRGLHVARGLPDGTFAWL